MFSESGKKERENEVQKKRVRSADGELEIIFFSPFRSRPRQKDQALFFSPESVLAQRCCSRGGRIFLSTTFLRGLVSRARGIATKKTRRRVRQGSPEAPPRTHAAKPHFDKTVKCGVGRPPVVAAAGAEAATFWCSRSRLRLCSCFVARLRPWEATRLDRRGQEQRRRGDHHLHLLHQRQQRQA